MKLPDSLQSTLAINSWKISAVSIPYCGHISVRSAASLSALFEGNGRDIFNSISPVSKKHNE